MRITWSRGHDSSRDEGRAFGWFGGGTVIVAYGRDFDVRYMRSNIDTGPIRKEHQECNSKLRSLRAEFKEEQVILETLIQKRDDRETLAEIIRNVAEQVKILDQLKKLSLRDQQRLLKGMLTGPIIISPVTPPAAGEKKPMQEIEVEEFIESLAVAPVSEMNVKTDAVHINIKVPPLRLNKPLLQDIFGDIISCEKSSPY